MSRKYQFQKIVKIKNWPNNDHHHHCTPGRAREIMIWFYVHSLTFITSVSEFSEQQWGDAETEGTAKSMPLLVSRGRIIRRSMTCLCLTHSLTQTHNPFPSSLHNNRNSLFQFFSVRKSIPSSSLINSLHVFLWNFRLSVSSFLSGYSPTFNSPLFR